LRLDIYPVQERYGLVWVQLVKDHQKSLPEMKEWDQPDYLQVLPESVMIHAAAGRQVEGFLDVSHFAFVHTESFGEPDNPVVPDYQVTKTASGFVADYISTVSNYSHPYKHLNPAGFLWHRRFESLPAVHGKTDGFLSEQWTASHSECGTARIGAEDATFCSHLPQLRPGCAALGQADFNHQVFAEDIDIVELQFPEDLPINLHEEAHFPGRQKFYFLP
jgi:vanillate O-demethylase monooxygenase subunit